ncbi:phosphatidylserine decarboxylase 1 [Actinomortierella ambigua]|uniref:Phosphatidylserine decarboxylase proenzyme 1, mitochondrial n=1 Tax=Actinomortierella ambigua TaxID=1343610 RepID=A0A9P6QDJ1_9FUNG|nr:phosphatidylserine decarboxylase 1 [Actinomortierella ambigua]
MQLWSPASSHAQRAPLYWRACSARASPVALAARTRVLSQRSFQSSSKTYSQQHQQQTGQQEPSSYFGRIRKAWKETPIKWKPIPIGLGLAFIAFLQYNKIMRREAERYQDHTAKPVIVGPWTVHIISELPLKTISQLWGAFNSITLPMWFRVPGFKLYSWIFGCNLDEMKDPNLKHYKDLSEFFYRELKDGARPVDTHAELVSPADGRVLHFGIVDGERVEQIKGMSYRLDHFLGERGKADEVADMLVSTHAANVVDEKEFAEVNGIPYSLDSLLGHDKQQQMEHKDVDAEGNIVPAAGDNKSDSSSDIKGNAGRDESIKAPQTLRPGNALFFCVIYLAPGDYHRFHSPTNWVAESRRHFSGELYSVSPWMVKQLQDLFVLNERVVLLGRWRHGFFSMVPVGATNVGSIVLNFDKELRTNRREDRYRRGYGELSYQGMSKTLGGLPLRVGEEMGGFKLGSTVVLVFEAPREFTFTLEAGQTVRMGQSLGRCIESS